MKNKFLSILALGLAFTLSSATTIPNDSDKEVGRQCCTKTTHMADGSSISITACAGWFLSNNANAMTRACAKVDGAMGIN
ncbi:MAG: hypothetical protein COS42_04220 [Flavobacteriales bacterium CG03_land_8_20_14_0_80_35_15]|nr:hypothetical protein [Flavobacteriia bacterium]PIV17550.1 MAG: hypothetical protein COS42_04220 [Flavobacteriales bacterium CG03_land_8_20_14_0_80_35_15]PJA04450.1 MAG: hypothetical protein COX71_11810 [Flavobacteriales bacterium CG_4_10_14_0_2_um_filter_35_18]